MHWMTWLIIMSIFKANVSVLSKIIQIKGFDSSDHVSIKQLVNNWVTKQLLSVIP